VVFGGASGTPASEGMGPDSSGDAESLAPASLSLAPQARQDNTIPDSRYGTRMNQRIPSFLGKMAFS